MLQVYYNNIYVVIITLKSKFEAIFEFCIFNIFQMQNLIAKGVKVAGIRWLAPVQIRVSLEANTW